MNVPSSSPSPRTTAFVLYVAVVVTAVMVLFPPFTSFNGTEYAFLLTGPEWARRMTTGGGPGLGVRLYWSLLLVQIGAVWALALGVRWFFGERPTALVY